MYLNNHNYINVIREAHRILHILIEFNVTWQTLITNIPSRRTDLFEQFTKLIKSHFMALTSYSSVTLPAFLCCEEEVQGYLVTFQNLVLVKNLDCLGESGDSLQYLMKPLGQQIVFVFSKCLLEVDILLGSLSPRQTAIKELK